jgi:nitroreductase
MTMQPSELLAALRFRYATKAFDPARKIPADTWEAIEKSLVLTPSSFGLQPWKFLIVENPELREKLRAASWGQGQVTDASHLVVLTARTDLTQADIDSWVARLSEVQGTPLDVLAGLSGVISSFSSAMTPAERQAWNTRQVYIALGQLMTACALLQIDTCPMEGFVAAKFDEILGLEAQGLTCAVLCPAGYRHADDRYASLPKIRFQNSDVIEHR